MAAGATPIVNVSREGPALLLTVAADQLTALRALDDFDREIKQLLERQPERAWIIDFREVTFLVTPAINTLLVLVKRLRADRGNLVLTGLNRNIRQIFELMRLNEVLSIAPDVASALTLIAGRDG